MTNGFPFGELIGLGVEQSPAVLLLGVGLFGNVRIKFLLAFEQSKGGRKGQHGT